MRKITIFTTALGILSLGLSIYLMVLAHQHNSLNNLMISALLFAAFIVCAFYVLFAGFDYINNFEKKILLKESECSLKGTWKELPFINKVAEVLNFRKFRKAILKHDLKKIFSTKNTLEQFLLYIEFKDFQSQAVYFNIENYGRIGNYSNSRLFEKYATDFFNMNEFVRLIHKKYDGSGITQNIEASIKAIDEADNALNSRGNILFNPTEVREHFSIPSVVQIAGINQVHRVPREYMNVISGGIVTYLSEYTKFYNFVESTVGRKDSTNILNSVITTQALVDSYEAGLIYKSQRSFSQSMF